MQILIVEDHAGIREALELLLELEGHVSTSVDCGEDALDLIKKETFDLVLLDLNTNGIPASDFMKNLSNHSTLTEKFARPVVGVLSASNGVEFESRRIGADLSIRKPFEHELLLERLKQVQEQYFFTASKRISS